MSTEGMTLEIHPIIKTQALNEYRSRDVTNSSDYQKHRPTGLRSGK